MASLAPRPSALIESLRSIGYTLETALADIIDNSITAGALRISVLFRWNEGSPWVAIADDGRGMGPLELVEAMRFGSKSPLEQRDAGDLGRFGLGMKTASISQCRQLTVASQRDGGMSACEWNLDDISRQDSDEWLVGILDGSGIQRDGLLSGLIARTIGTQESGTLVLWRNFDASLVGGRQGHDERRFSELLGSARTHLSTVFHRFISPDLGQKATKIDFNGSVLEALNPFGPAIPARQELPTQDIILKDGKITVQPFVLPHHSKVSRKEYQKYAGEDGYQQNQGFYIYRQRRLIMKATWFQLIKKEELNKLIRIRVDIPNSLDQLWQINVNKSQIWPPESVRRELRKIIKRIEGAGKLVFTRRATTLRNRIVTPVWKRMVSDGKIRYCINEEHPVLRQLIASTSTEYAKQVRASFRLIDQSFPYDAYYADAARDEVEFDDIAIDDNEIRLACEQAIMAFRSCGFKREQIREALLGTEIPGATEILIDELLATMGKHG